MNVSTYGLHFIAQQEGEVLHVYPDQTGKATIGVGHLLLPGESYPDGITHEQAMQLLAQDVHYAERAVNYGATVAPTQHQFDAMVSLAFNIGSGGFASSSVLRLHNAHDPVAAAASFALWCKRQPKPGELVKDTDTSAMREPRIGELVEDQGLKARREEEAKLYLMVDG